MSKQTNSAIAAAKMRKVKAWSKVSHQTFQPDVYTYTRNN